MGESGRCGIKLDRVREQECPTGRGECHLRAVCAVRRDAALPVLSSPDELLAAWREKTVVDQSRGRVPCRIDDVHRDAVPEQQPKRDVRNATRAATSRRELFVNPCVSDQGPLKLCLLGREEREGGAQEDDADECGWDQGW